jgi:hypothetical protein
VAYAREFRYDGAGRWGVPVVEDDVDDPKDDLRLDPTGAALVPRGPCGGGSNTVTLGGIDGFSRKRGPGFVNGHAARRARRVVAVTRYP